MGAGHLMGNEIGWKGERLKAQHKHLFEFFPPSLRLYVPGMALAKTIVLNEPTKPDYWAVPSAVFSNPELSTVVSTAY